MIPSKLSEKMLQEAKAIEKLVPKLCNVHEQYADVSRRRGSWGDDVQKELVRADATLSAIEILHPDDADVATMRARFNDVRSLVENYERCLKILNLLTCAADVVHNRQQPDPQAPAMRDAEITEACANMEQILHAAPKPPRKEGEA